MKNPNGYGSVVKLSGRRRRPYVVRKTQGYDDRGYPIYAILGYFESKKEAMIVLAEYNKNPYDIDESRITFSQLFERYCKEELPKLSIDNQYSRRSAYGHCSKLYTRVYKELRRHDMQSCIDECGRGASSQTNIRSLFRSLDAFAYDLDIISKQYSANLTVAQKEESRKGIFTDEEVQALHEHEGDPFVDETLFMLYTGMRVLEMLTIKCENIDLEHGIMRGGLKTDAGKNRVIPIHSRILPLVKRHMNDGTLFEHEPKQDSEYYLKLLRTSFTASWKRAMQRLGISHNTHECRHTFRSKLDGQNKVCIDLIMGHKSADVGERVYTHKTIEELKKTIENLSYEPPKCG